MTTMELKSLKMDLVEELLSLNDKEMLNRVKNYLKRLKKMEAIAEALEARELIKISVLNNCADDPREIAQMVAERTRSQVVQVIGKKIVLYKESKDNKKIILP